MRTKDDFIAEAHRNFALAQPNRANVWAPFFALHGPPAAFDSARGLRARDEDLEELARRLARDPRREDYEKARELDDDDHKRLMEMVDRERGTEDRRRARDGTDEERRERIPASSITPMSPEDMRYLENDRRRMGRDNPIREMRAMDAAERRLRADGLGHLAFDEASSAAGIYALGCKAMGVDLRGVDSAAWQTIYEAKRRGGAPVAMDSRDTEDFYRMFPGARHVTIAAYNDPKLGR